ncbi:phosphonate ABC transporter substrate-binding protein [Sedimenticola hydrogenitrophicus]|uniref:phosphonate ABC transporter substrate-binding protein n=1 Tax=Sedimenticola hydrogenitrophicus TaxID=2967975 RepID=UPI0023AFD01C|nr:phosphonate ABC transporter substrate-binding protein [Sedimenticola hydrogenitrophicus]
MYVKKIIISTLLTASLAGASSAALARDLIMGLIPAENNEEMVKTFEPMRVYLENKLGQKVKVFTATDYAGVIEGMKKKRVDIAWFGPLSYYLAEMEAGAEPFAVGIREGSSSATYKSILLAPCGNGIKSIEGMKGKSVAFVDPASTSGGLVPTYMVKKATGKMPQDFFGKFTYAGSHDAAELAVKNKTVDAAADNDITYGKMLDKGLISKQTNCVIAESDPLPGSPLVYRGDLPSDLKLKIQGAILSAHKEIKVAGYGKISHYVAASPEDYQVVRDMVKELGLKKDQLK